MDEKFNKLKEWFIKNGGYIRPSIIRKKTENGYYGLFTNEKIEKDTIIIKTPKHLYLNILDSLKNIDADDFIKKILSLLIELNKGTESFFHDCFKLLPTLDNFKLYSIILCENDITNKLNILGFDIKKSQYDISNYEKIYEKLILINDENKYIENLDSDKITYAILIYNNYYWDNGMDPIIQFINHKKGNSIKSIDSENNVNIMKVNKTIQENSEIFIIYDYKKSSEELAFCYDFIDMENFEISLSITYIGSTAIDFYKAKMLMDLGYCVKLDGKKIIIYDNGVLNISKDTLKISADNLDNLFKVTQILAIKNESDINSKNNVEIYKIARDILKMNLGTINIKEQDYLEEIASKYPHIGILIQEKYNLIQKSINYINKLLLDYINN